MTKINFESDFLDFIRLCNQFEVEYLVIGGYAVSFHGYPRSTKDLDVCIKISEANADKMMQVIDEFGFASLKLSKEDFMKPGFITQLGHEPLRIDIINDLDGVPLLGKPVNFIGYNELLKVKAKAGRPQDLADIDKLKKRNSKK